MNSQSSSTQRPNLLFIHSDQHNPAVTGWGVSGGAKCVDTKDTKRMEFRRNRGEDGSQTSRRKNLILAHVKKSCGRN